jgi:hypothetical protein
MTKILLLFFLVFQINQNTEDSHTKAISLLKGVEQERLKYDCFQLYYTEHRMEENKTVEQIVDFDHGKILKEHLKNDHFQGMMSLLLNDVVYIKTSADETDVGIVTLGSTKAYGADIYDPRLFGLTDLLNHQSTIDLCLSYASGKKFSVRPTKFNGKNLYLVEWNDGRVYWEFFIEEPSFRVWRFAISDPYVDVQVDSEYSNSTLGPFPSKIRMVRTKGKEKKKRNNI